MVTFTDSDDRRSAHLRNQAIQNANAVRERRATVENPQWAMSRPADWYQNRENLSSIKGTLANMPAVTTDQDESRNMYQMLMNQMKGGDRGARLIDTRGLPDQARRYGRKLFYDPEKSPGFSSSLRTMGGDLIPGLSRSPSPATLRVNEYNPFPKAGFGKDWYRDQFPIASGLGSLMEGMENVIPGISWLKRFLPKRNRVPLERDLSWAPEDVGSYTEIPEIPFVEDEAADRSDPLPLENWFYTPPFDDEVSIMDLPIEEDITETITEDDTETITEDDTETITEGDGEKFVLQKAEFSRGNLGTQGKYDYTPSLDLNIMNIKDAELKKKATDAAIQFNNMWIEKEGKEEKSDMYEFERLWDEYMAAVEAGSQ
jgi:hypothetical protein